MYFAGHSNNSNFSVASSSSGNVSTSESELQRVNPSAKSPRWMAHNYSEFSVTGPDLLRRDDPVADQLAVGDDAGGLVTPRGFTEDSFTRQ